MFQDRDKGLFGEEGGDRHAPALLLACRGWNTQCRTECVLRSYRQRLLGISSVGGDTHLLREMVSFEWVGMM